VDWCYSVTVQDDKQLRGMALGAPWTGMAALNPFNMFGDPSRRADGGWGGWVYAIDADNGVWKWRANSNYPVVSGITPTAGGVVFFGDVGGNFYALNAATGEKLFAQDLGGALGGGVITYTANGAQKVAVAAGFTMLAWPVKIVTAKVVILGLDTSSASL
jgi:alcohol dehydrogenase (cytochrome c)